MILVSQRTKNGQGPAIGDRPVGEKCMTYEIYLRGTPNREGAAVGAAVGCSVWSLSVTASKWMDFKDVFPFQKRSFESERAIQGQKGRDTVETVFCVSLRAA